MRFCPPAVAAATFAVGLVGEVGCSPVAAYGCSVDGNCVDDDVQGVCEPTGYCSFPDETCDSTRRYGKLAPPEIAGACVDLPGSSGAADGADTFVGSADGAVSADTTQGVASTGADAATANDGTADGGCTPMSCIDADGDGWGDGDGCLGPDCDDANPAHHDRCFYVAPDGDDTSDGSITTPWVTFGRAVSALAPGDSLVVRDGIYSTDVHGPLRINCGEGVATGTAEAPIFVRAEHERMAQILTHGTSYGIRVEGCQHWTVLGFTVLGGDASTTGGGVASTIVSVASSQFVTLRRILAAYNNRYFNSILYDVYESSDVLFEECEGRQFHRTAFNTWYSDRVTYRRCFAEVGTHADLPGCVSPAQADVPFCSSNPDGGDSGFSAFRNNNDVRYENCVAAGPLTYGFTIGSYGQNASHVGNIAFGGPVYGIATFAGSGSPTVGVSIRDMLVVGARSAGMYLESPLETTISGVSILDGEGHGIRVIESADALCVNQVTGCSVDIERGLLLDLGDDAFALSSAVHWSIRDSIAHGTTVDFPPGEPIEDEEGAITRCASVAAAQGIGPGECAVYIPDGSPAASAASTGEDIGANIVWRIEGEATSFPLWDLERGFCCGPSVMGVNDDPTATCSVASATLHAFDADCPPPPDYPLPQACPDPVPLCGASG